MASPGRESVADYFNTSVDFLIGHTDIPHRIEPARPWDLNEREARACLLYTSDAADER